jgi:hypothetical protein
MSDHVKTSIRNAVAKALDGLAATGDSVFSGRTTPPPAGSLPCLLVYTGNETSALDGASKVQQRRLQVLIEACLKELDDLELLGETIQKEVETALGAPGLDLGGAKSCQTHTARPKQVRYKKERHHLGRAARHRRRAAPAARHPRRT